jgi:hypothetical protein
MSTSALSRTDFDSTVLRQSLLGNIQMAENFYARNDGGLKAFDLRRHRNFLQHTVDAVANAQFVFEGFEVNVRRAQLDGVAQHLIDEANDRRVLGGVVEVRVFLVFIDDLERRFFFERADGVSADAEALLHFALDDFARREHRLELQTGERLEGVESLRREEAARGDFHRAVHSAQREQFFFEQNASGEQ